MTDKDFRVLVGVGPDGVGDGVLDFVADEASRRGTGIALVHVVHVAGFVPAGVQAAEAFEDALSTVGRRTLKAAADRLRSRVDDRVPIRSNLITGPVVRTLVELGNSRDLVVMERRDLPLHERLLTMRISTGVAARSRTPVAVVPHTWRPAVPDLPVAVGIDQALDVWPQVEFAARYAHDVGRPLRLLHALWLAESYWAAPTFEDLATTWTKEIQQDLDENLDKLPGLAPTTTSEVLWGPPADVLVKATKESSALVLSRRRRRKVPAQHLGPVTRTVLAHARCPVLLADRD